MAEADGGLLSCPPGPACLCTGQTGKGTGVCWESHPGGGPSLLTTPRDRVLPYGDSLPGERPFWWHHVAFPTITAVPLCSGNHCGSLPAARGVCANCAFGSWRGRRPVGSGPAPGVRGPWARAASMARPARAPPHLLGTGAFAASGDRGRFRAGVPRSPKSAYPPPPPGGHSRPGER